MRATIMRWAAGGVAAAALAIGVACSSSSAPATTANTTTGAAAQVEATRPAAVDTSVRKTTGEMTVAELVKLAEPSIVRVATSTGVGSGFVVADDGYILTNNHVVAGQSSRTASPIKITMSDGAEYQAKVVGTDARSDLALLKIDATGLAALKLGNLADVMVGQDVVAIGYALDLSGGDGPGYTVTRGIISAKNRMIPSEQSNLGAIQTDAAINHGNSGGPLINMAGEVVGVNTALAPDPTTGGTAPGIGFAVGSDIVKAVYEQLRADGRVNRALLGISNFEALRPARARELGIPADSGGVYLAATANVQPGGPAATAGMQGGDVIVGIAGTAVRNETDLAIAMIKHKPGDKIPVEVFRSGKKVTLQVTLGNPQSAQ